MEEKDDIFRFEDFLGGDKIEDLKRMKSNLLNEGLFNEDEELEDEEEVDPKFNPYKTSFENDDDVIKLILRIAYFEISNQKINTLSNILTTDFREELFGFDPNSKKGKYFDSNIQKISKYQNNYIDFYKTEIEKFNKIGNLMIKKISKLYSMAKDRNSKDSGIIRKIYNKVNP